MARFKWDFSQLVYFVLFDSVELDVVVNPFSRFPIGVNISDETIGLNKV